MTKLVTFDLWGTLIKSNPEYITQRNSLYAGYNIDPDLRKKLKVAIDETMVSTGISFSVFTMYSLLLSMSGQNNKLWLELHEENKKLVEKYPPLLIYPDTVEGLELLKKKDMVLGVISNTTFISGESLDKMLKHYLIRNYFMYCYYSDQYRHCKPHYHVFDLTVLSVKTYQRLSENDTYLHIGDNPIADNPTGASTKWKQLLINPDSTSLVELVKDIQ